MSKMKDTLLEEEQERDVDAEYESWRDQKMIEEIEFIQGYSQDHLRSYYLKNPRVMVAAIEMLHEGDRLCAANHFAAAVVFYGIAIELLLKATILRPVVSGLVLIESFAELIVEHALAKVGYEGYQKLLKQIFSQLVGIDMGQIKRPDVAQTLWEECSKVRSLRNKVVHEGATRTQEEAVFASEVTWSVVSLFVEPVLKGLKLDLAENSDGELRPI